MDISAEQYTNLLGSETAALNNTVLAYRLKATSLLCILVLNSFITNRTSKLFLKLLQKNNHDKVIDPDDVLCERLEEIQQQMKENYYLLDECKTSGLSYNFLIDFSQSLIKKTFNNYGLIIINIQEHDVDVENEYSEAFTSVDNLMAHLNS
ncbi:MAG: hypothetical protein K9L22_10590 [Methylococcaceae bacterium]|nr:hypothetical protein [Methylococcaceae bacterium]